MDDYPSKTVRPEQLRAALERCMTHGEAPQAPGATPGVIDQTVLEGIHKELGDDEPTLVIDLITLFLNDSEERLAVMRQVLPGAPAPLAWHAAHTLKGSAATIGARQLAALCGTYEQQLAANDVGAAQTLVKLAALHAQTAAELRRLRDGYLAQGQR